MSQLKQFGVAQRMYFDNWEMKDHERITMFQLAGKDFHYQTRSAQPYSHEWFFDFLENSDPEIFYCPSNTKDKMGCRDTSGNLGSTNPSDVVSSHYAHTFTDGKKHFILDFEMKAGAIDNTNYGKGTNVNVLHPDGHASKESNDDFRFTVNADPTVPTKIDSIRSTLNDL